MVRAREWDGGRRLARVPASRRPWWAAHPAPASALRLEWRAAAPAAVLVVDGDLDAATGRHLEGFVTASPTAGLAVLELDLVGVRWLDSAGLASLLELRRWCEQRGAEFRVRGAPPSVERVFALAGFDERLGAAPDRRGPVQELALF